MLAQGASPGSSGRAGRDPSEPRRGDRLPRPAGRGSAAPPGLAGIAPSEDPGLAPWANIGRPLRGCNKASRMASDRRRPRASAPARRTALFAGLALAVSVGSSGARKLAWDFERESSGALPQDVSPESGRWEVVALAEGGRALEQTGTSQDELFNVALARETSARDFELSVRLRAVGGKEDQGGGLVWRAVDAKNYYLARFNPLEDNVRVYAVVDGKRTNLQSADVPGSPGWHTLRVRVRSDDIVCDLDGRTLLDVRDRTFPDAGRVGLWTKADARTQFDDLTLLPTAGGR
jgi:hypothetical protein